MTENLNDKYDQYFKQQTTPAAPSGAAQIADKYSYLIPQQDSDAAQVHALDDPNPDVAARANRYEREMGVPAALAQDDIKPYDAMARQRQVGSMAARYPAIGKFMADPRNSAVAQDDLPSLASISQRFQELNGRKPTSFELHAAAAAPPKWVRDIPPPAAPVSLLSRIDTEGNAAISSGLDYLKSLTLHGVAHGAYDVVTGLPRALKQGGAMLEEGVAGLAQAIPETLSDAKMFNSSKPKGLALPDPSQATSLRDQGASIVPYLDAVTKQTETGRKYWHGVTQALDPQTDSRTARALLNGVAMTPMTATALGLAATGNPELGAGMIAGVTGGQSYGTGRDAGLAPGDAAAFAARDAAVEYLTEVVPAMAFAKDVAVGTPWFKRMMHNMLEEQVGEQTATALQDLNQWATVDANKGKTFAQYLAERPGAAYDTALAVAVSVGGSHVGHLVAEPILNRADKIITARENARTMNGVMEDAAQSKTRTRDPEAFKQFVAQQVEGTPAENIHIPVEAVDKLMQSEGFEDTKDGFFEGLKGQIEEARAIGPDSDIVIPLKDATTHLAGTPAWEALKDDARIDGGGSSVREALAEGDKVREEIATRGDQILQQANDASKAAEPTQQVFEQVKQQLKAIGRSEHEATHIAAVTAAQAEVGGANFGITAKEYHDRYSVQYQTQLGDHAAATTVMDQERGVWWHGSPSGDLRGGATGLHLGTRESARQALEARIGVPAVGEWDGTREYGKTLLAGKKTQARLKTEGRNVGTGFNVDAPEEDYYASDAAHKYADGSVMPSTVKPILAPYRINGKMTNTVSNPHGDWKANGYMKAALKKGNAKNGYYYKNEAEDAGSISAVVPNGSHIERVFEQSSAPPLTGLPASSPGAFQPARDAAARYADRAGLPYYAPTDFAKVDPARGARIAAAYEAMKDDPTDPAVKAAYDAMIAETLAQWREITLTGLQVEFVDGADPYAGNPWGAVRDVRDNNHLYVFNTEDGYGQDALTPEQLAANPMLAIVEGETWSGKLVRVNDVFRVVHDYFGHIKEGVGFRARGEENAWRMHSAMYSPLARRAMTTETRGQNSWLNFGPHGEKNQTASVADTEFADQKIGLLPQWVTDEGAPEFNKPDAAAANKAMPRTKVVGEDGKAKVVYHGTPYVFSEFRNRPRPDWFSESPEQATTYSDPRRRGMINGYRNIHPVYLDIQNPLDLGDPAGGGAQDFAERFGLPRDTFETNDGDSAYAHYNHPRFTAAAMAAGYDGIRVLEGGHVTWAPFHRSQIASIFQDPDKPRVLFQSDENPVFYSALGRAIEQSKTARAPAAQWKATLQNAPGVKAEELEWSGVLDFLDMAEAAGETLSKEQLGKALNDGGIHVSEALLGGPAKGVDAQALEARTMELLNDRADQMRFVDDDQRDMWINSSYGIYQDQAEKQLIEEQGGVTQFSNWSSDSANPSYRELLITLPIGQGRNPERAPDTHWDQPAVVAHVRFMEKRDVEGKRVLFIEEVQSDWHQKGRDQGYAQRSSPAEQERLRLAMVEADAAYADAAKERVRLRDEAIKRGTDAGVLTEEDLGFSLSAQAMRALLALKDETALDEMDKQRAHAQTLDLASAEARQAYENSRRPGGIPDAPFRASWPALTMKRAIRWAVDNGYQRVAWTTGEQQAERYNLSTAVGTLTYRFEEDGRVKVHTQGDRGYEALRQYGEMGPAGSTLFTRQQAEEAFGREIAGKMWAGEGGAPDSTGHRKLEGSDLRVGGEGMKAFYDRNLVNITNNLIKKHKTKVGAIAILSSAQEREVKRAESMLRLIEAGIRDDEKLAAVDPAAELRLQSEFINDGGYRARDNILEQLTELRKGDQQPGFDITPELATAATQGFPLFQNTDGPRGQIALYPEHSVITLFENANLSTLIHETGHLFLERLRLDAARADAPQKIKDDWAKVQAWFTENKVPLRDGAIPREAHELWARGFERYTMEGKSPSAALQSAFTAFRGWLLRIYQVVQNLRSPINPEIRQVMDRMLATQDAIDEYSRQQNVKAAWTDAEQAGMTEAEWAAYQASVVQAKDDAYDALLFKTMHRIAQQRKAVYKEKAQGIRRDATRAVMDEPRFKALRMLRTGKINEHELGAKLDSDWLAERYGEDAAARLPANVRVGQDGMNADDLAQLSGFGSGDEMVKALFDIAQQTAAMRASGDKRQLHAKLIDDQTKAAIDDQGLSDPMTDGSIEQEAIEAIDNDKQGDVLSTELRHLARRTKASPTPYKLAREWAKRKIEAGIVNDVSSRSALQRYARAAAKASRAAEEAIIAGKTDEAFRQKQAQMLNHALFVEAKAAADEVDTIVSRMKKLAGRAAMKSVDQDYMDQVHALLERYDFRPRSQKYLDEVGGFEKWAARRAVEGFEVLTPDRLNLQGVHYSRVPVEELYSLRDTVESVMQLGRLKQKFMDAQVERNFDDVRKAMLAHMANLKARKLPTRTFNEDTIGKTVRQMIAGGLKVSTLALDMDYQDPNGPMMNLLVHRANDASLARDRLREQVLTPIAKALGKMNRKHWKRLNELVTIPELTLNVGLGENDPRLGKPLVLTRKDLLSIALNTGNLSNFEKMTEGERWPPATVRAVLDRELSADDWQFVQTMWDAVETLWPHIVKVERQLSGVVPEKVTNTPIQTRHGEFPGGYWPVVYDGERSKTAEKNDIKAADDMFGRASGLGTPKGHTITRTEATGPMIYSLEHILFRHIEQVITRVTFAEYARDVMRVLADPKISGEIDLKLGKEYRDEIPLWLRDQILPVNDGKSGDFADRLLRFARQGIVSVGMGLRIATGVAQISGLQSSLARLGGKQTHKLFYHVAQQVLTGVGNMARGERSALHEFVFERSEMMQRRMRENTMEVEQASRRLKGKHSWRDAITPWQFWHIGMVDLHVVSIPTWITGYRQAIDRGMSETEAARYADQMVTTSQGSGRQEHLARWQRSQSEFKKLFFLFYTPFNVIFNAQWEAARGVKRGDYTRAANLTMFMLVAQTLTDAILSGDMPGDDPDEWAKWLLRNVFFGLFSGVPIVRDAANYGERKISGQYATFGGTPVARIFEEMTKASADAYAVQQGEKDFEPAMVPGLANSIGMGLHLPLGQLGQTTKFLWQYKRGEVQPQSIGDWYVGLTKGKLPKESN